MFWTWEQNQYCFDNLKKKFWKAAEHYKSRLFDKLSSLNEEKINYCWSHLLRADINNDWPVTFFNLGWFESAHNTLVLKDSCFYLSPQQVILTYVMVRKITVHGQKNNSSWSEKWIKKTSHEWKLCHGKY